MKKNIVPRSPAGPVSKRLLLILQLLLHLHRRRFEVSVQTDRNRSHKRRRKCRFPLRERGFPRLHHPHRQTVQQLRRSLPDLPVPRRHHVFDRDSRTTSLDTKIPLQAGLNRIRFDGSDSVLDFELVYTGLTSPEILGYGQSQSEAETVPSDAPSISGSISDSPDAELHSSASNLFTKVSQPAALLEFQLEKETDITVFVAADLRNNSSGRFKAGVFDVTLKGDNYPDTEIIHHATADSSWGDFLWN